jgi:hypothetical protein
MLLSAEQLRDYMLLCTGVCDLDLTYSIVLPQPSERERVAFSMHWLACTRAHPPCSGDRDPAPWIELEM